MIEKPPTRVRFGPFEADLHTHELWKYGTKIRLVGQPFEVLAILLRKPGELVTRDELRSRLWAGDTYVDFDHGLNAAVNKLRDALSDSAESPRYVETLPRRGYRFIGPVTVTSQDGSEAPAVAPAVIAVSEPAGVSSNNPNQVASASEARSLLHPPAARSWLRPAIAASLVLALIVGAGSLLKRVYSGVFVREAAEPVQRIRPLTTLSDPTSEPAFSPDGNYVAFRREAANPEAFGIFVKDVATDQLDQLTGSTDDCCPAWSPDGRSIAFARRGKKDFQYDIFVAPVSRGRDQALAAGPAHKVDTEGVTPRQGALAWSPDGKGLAFSSGASISLITLADPTIHRLTTPPPGSEDWGPSFSPDGSTLLFVRTQRTGFLEEIMSIPVAGGDVTRITSEHSRILGPPQWSSDGQSVIFASDRGSHPALWRVSATRAESPVEINDSGWYPAVSRRGFRLAYQRVTHSLSVWTLDVPASGEEQHVLVPATSETDQGPGPQISPDGRKLAYMSDRSGTMEIWMSDRDGGNATQLTAIGFAGTPRWSPDSKSVVFDAGTRNGPTIFAVRVDGGAPRQLVSDNGENVCPSWSHDGKWVYFASHRTSGEFQVWKVPADGGAPVQITRHGGHAALESLDGKYLYYAKTEYANPEIWQVPVGGGPERLVSPLIRPASWAAWTVTEKGIIFAASLGTSAPGINLFDFARRRVTNLATIKTVPFWLGASRDGKSVVFDQPGWQQAQIMLVENFR